jgi:putative SOS response-associated peptidase YedK
MCGRYARRSDKQRIAGHFHVHGPSLPDFGPSYNVAPRTFPPVLRLNRDTGEREIVMMRWGLIPYSYWAKDATIGIRTINAKDESHIALDQRYARQVVASPEDAVAYLQALVNFQEEGAINPV